LKIYTKERLRLRARSVFSAANRCGASGRTEEPAARRFRREAIVNGVSCSNGWLWPYVLGSASGERLVCQLKNDLQASWVAKASCRCGMRSLVGMPAYLNSYVAIPAASWPG